MNSGLHRERDSDFLPLRILFFLCLDLFSPAPVAHRDVPVISAEKNLFTLGDDPAARINAGIDGRFGAAFADGLDFGDRIGKFHETHRSREEFCLEVGPETKAEHRNILVVNQKTKFIDLGRSKKLAFIGDYDRRLSVLMILFNDAVGRQNDFRVLRKTDTAFDYIRAVPGVRRWLDKPDSHSLLFIIEFRDESLGRFG